MFSTHSHLKSKSSDLTLPMPSSSTLDESWPAKFYGAASLCPFLTGLPILSLSFPALLLLVYNTGLLALNSLPNPHMVCFLTSSALCSNVLLERPSQTTRCNIVTPCPLLLPCPLWISVFLPCCIFSSMAQMGYCTCSFQYQDNWTQSQGVTWVVKGYEIKIWGIVERKGVWLEMQFMIAVRKLKRS